MSEPFYGSSGKTVNIDVSFTSQSVKVSENQTTQIRVVNDGTATAWIDFGKSDISTTPTTGMPILSGMAEVHTVESIDGSPIYVAAIASGSTGKIYFTPGNGF